MPKTRLQKQKDLQLNINLMRLGGRAPMMANGMLAENVGTILGTSDRICQTCHVWMTEHTVPRKSPDINRKRTRGHLCLTRQSPGGYRHWIHQCRGCNSDQAGLSYSAWMSKLREAGDPRKPIVFSTLMAMLELGVSLDQIQPVARPELMVHKSRTQVAQGGSSVSNVPGAG